MPDRSQMRHFALPDQGCIKRPIRGNSAPARTLEHSGGRNIYVLMADRPKKTKSKQVRAPAKPSENPVSPLAAGSDHLFRLLVENVIDYAIFLLDPSGTVTT